MIGFSAPNNEFASGFVPPFFPGELFPSRVFRFSMLFLKSLVKNADEGEWDDGDKPSNPLPAS